MLQVFGCDVFLHKNEMGDINEVGATVTFNIALNKRGQPQATQVRLPTPLGPSVLHVTCSVLCVLPKKQSA